MNKYSFFFFFFQCLDKSHSAPLESSIVVAPSDCCDLRFTLTVALWGDT